MYGSLIQENTRSFNRCFSLTRVFSNYFNLSEVRLSCIYVTRATPFFDSIREHRLDNARLFVLIITSSF